MIADRPVWNHRGLERTGPRGVDGLLEQHARGSAGQRRLCALLRPDPRGDTGARVLREDRSEEGEESAQGSTPKLTQLRGFQRLRDHFSAKKGGEDRPTGSRSPRLERRGQNSFRDFRGRSLRGHARGRPRPRLPGWSELLGDRPRDRCARRVLGSSRPSRSSAVQDAASEKSERRLVPVASLRRGGMRGKKVGVVRSSLAPRGTRGWAEPTRVPRCEKGTSLSTLSGFGGIGPHGSRRSCRSAAAARRSRIDHTSKGDARPSDSWSTRDGRGRIGGADPARQRGPQIFLLDEFAV